MVGQRPRAASRYYSEGDCVWGGRPGLVPRDTFSLHCPVPGLTLSWPGRACLSPLPVWSLLGEAWEHSNAEPQSGEELVVEPPALGKGPCPPESAPGLSGWRLSSGPAWCRLGQAGIPGGRPTGWKALLLLSPRPLFSSLYGGRCSCSGPTSEPGLLSNLCGRPFGSKYGLEG